MALRKTKTTTTAKKNPWRSSHVPLPSWIMFWALVLCTMALIVVNFNKAFSPATVDSVDDQTAAQFAAIRASLEKQVNDLQTQMPVSGKRVVFDGSQNPSNEIALLNRDKPNMAATYVDTKYKVSVSIPYNFDWGKPSLVLTPYDADSGIISYGTLEMIEGAIGRSQSLVMSDKTTVAKTREHLKNLAPEGKSKESTIRGIPVISYEAPSLNCRMVVAMGRSATYTFQDCRDGIPELEPEAILATIKAQ